MPQIVFWPHCYLALRSRSKVGVKVTGQGQVQRSRSNFWHATVDIRGSALPSAARSKGESFSVQDVCVSTNCADAVDRLLISEISTGLENACLEVILRLFSMHISHLAWIIVIVCTLVYLHIWQRTYMYKWSRNAQQGSLLVCANLIIYPQHWWICIGCQWRNV